MEACELRSDVQKLLPDETLRGKQKADRMEAIIFTLHQFTESEPARWMLDLATNTLEGIMEALLAIGRMRNADSSSRTVEAGATANDIREWIKTFQCDRGDIYTHSSLFGGKD